MEKRKHLYADRKHPAVWLAGLFLLASAVIRIIVFSGMDGVGVWRQIIWPVFAVVLFALIMVLSNIVLKYLEKKEGDLC